MGILGLSMFIAGDCPKAIKEGEIKHYFGRKVAIDVFMCLYQFLIAPPDLKYGELAKRAERRDEAQKALQQATEAGNEADIDKLAKSAPCAAEAQCAALVKVGKVYATATVLLRQPTFSKARKMPVKEINYNNVLEGFGLTSKEFIDLCILLGCDYYEGIKGI
ncbi:Flap endonuclease 1 [Lucilia cuprina]|nr:Flap endonuclease 1 [Lucilia cuprina]